MDDLRDLATAHRVIAVRFDSLLRELAAWRDVGAAVQRVLPNHPGLEAEIEQARQAIVAERTADQRPEPTHANVPPDGI